MKQATRRISWSWQALILIGGLLLPARAWADQVVMQNGERFFGAVVSLDADTLVLQNQFLGTVRLPRTRLAAVTFGTVDPARVLGAPLLTNGAPRSSRNPATNAPSAMLRQLSSQTNLVQQVQSQFLSDASPEAQAKFNELLGGLVSGRLNVDDIRTQAKSAAQQLRALRKDLGDDNGALLDSYLAILDRFVSEVPEQKAESQKPKAGMPKAEE